MRPAASAAVGASPSFVGPNPSNPIDADTALRRAVDGLEVKPGPRPAVGEADAPTHLGTTPGVPRVVRAMRQVDDTMHVPRPYLRGKGTTKPVELDMADFGNFLARERARRSSR